ncbi:MAG: hypothetical protein Q4F66_10320 [Clostridium sp.]|nr:hypothetical protein [Clostridium sp.]
MKKIAKRLAAFLLIICTISSTCAYAAPEAKYQPIADSYSEGIYRFQSGIGNTLSFKLLTSDKPVIIMLIEDDNLKYYAQLDKNFKEVRIFLNDPLKTHTAVVIGDGQLSFTFE